MWPLCIPNSRALYKPTKFGVQAIGEGELLKQFYILLLLYLVTEKYQLPALELVSFVLVTIVNSSVLNFDALRLNIHSD